METGDPNPWHRASPDTLTYRASPVRVFLSLTPLIAFLLAGSALQYALQGTLSPGMGWVLGGAAAFVLTAALILPRINYLEFTPQHFTLREPFGRKRIAWGDIEPGSIGYVVRTFCHIPLFTNIGFRLRPDSRHLTTLRVMASAVTGMHVYFVNLYSIGRDEIVETLRRYQAWYGTDLRGRSGVPETGSGEGPVEPVAGDPAVPGPKYNLIVLNDDTHTYGYVAQLLQEVFGVSAERAAVFTRVIDRMGRAVVFTGSLEEVTRKREQILAHGPDTSLPQSAGPLGVEVSAVG
jgi:ATP-dependent Clp protease adaptor protein ClpS